MNFNPRKLIKKNQITLVEYCQPQAKYCRGLEAHLIFHLTSFYSHKPFSHEKKTPLWIRYKECS